MSVTQELDRNQSLKQNTNICATHADDHLTLLAEALGWDPANTAFAAKKHEDIDEAGNRVDRTPAPEDQWGWGVGILSAYPLTQRHAIPCVGSSICGKQVLCALVPYQAAL